MRPTQFPNEMAILGFQISGQIIAASHDLGPQKVA